MKYLRYIYKRIGGQEFYCGVGDSVIENLKYERKNSADSTAETKKKTLSSIIPDGAGKGKAEFRDGGRHEKGGVW